eukprot:21023-Eustigmatos_ZCMA.PRE.1
MTIGQCGVLASSRSLSGCGVQWSSTGRQPCVGQVHQLARFTDLQEAQCAVRAPPGQSRHQGGGACCGGGGLLRCGCAPFGG